LRLEAGRDLLQQLALDFCAQPVGIRAQDVAWSNDVQRPKSIRGMARFEQSSRALQRDFRRLWKRQAIGRRGR
jgi:hypothetical protein